MFAHRRMRPAGTGLRGTPSIPKLLGAMATGCVLALSTQACSGPPPSPFAGRNPADPQARVAPAAYRPVTGSYTSQRPVEPRPWSEQNERVAPAAKP